MFINISNHNSSKWEKEQLRQALEFGEILNLEFPDVDPDMTSDEVELVKNHFLKNINNYNISPSDTIFHIMGEMTLTYKLVYHFKSEGYTCIASTTTRIVEEKGKGESLRKFKFIRFREY